MVSREHRFHGLGSLRFVHSRGSVVRGPMFVIKYALNNRRQSYRATVVVSKKVSKSAVVRNRIRRRIYELVRAHEAHITKPYDIAIMVHDEKASDIKSDVLKNQLDKQLKKADIIS